jgi:hypothetical protein
MRWITNYSLLNDNGRVIAEIDSIGDEKDNWSYRTVVKRKGNEYYDYFNRLKEAKDYLETYIKFYLNDIENLRGAK